MPNRTPREIELERALIDLTIYAAPFSSGRGMCEVRTNLKKAIHTASKALKSEPCARDPQDALRKMADEADAERRDDPNYRADQDG